jgi:hypothetical protein
MIRVAVDKNLKGPAQYTEKRRTITINPDYINDANQGANNLGHEVGHDEYYREDGTLSSLQDREASERNAFEIGGAIDRSLGVAEQFPDIEKGIERSVRTACDPNPDAKSCK